MPGKLARLPRISSTARWIDIERSGSRALALAAKGPDPSLAKASRGKAPPAKSKCLSVECGRPAISVRLVWGAAACWLAGHAANALWCDGADAGRGFCKSMGLRASCVFLKVHAWWYALSSPPSRISTHRRRPRVAVTYKLYLVT